jgi:exodeoxyribonuclease VII large subunit
MGNEAITVSEFNSLLNQTLSFAYPEVIVEGEVSSFKVNQGKWVFFDLKDEDSLVGCFITIYQLKTELEDGMLIRVKATPQLTKWGKFSLTVKEVELAGEGSVKRAFEMLKAKFEKEGLFEQDRKRQLPQYPQKIALITSNQAAAYNDFLTIINDRWAGLEIEHIQVQVQGPSAPLQIAEAIDYLNELKGYDALVIIRGGGSAEDLQAFNTEEVVRAVYGSRIPTLVAIGHEDDVSLAELAADIRGATPTDAARRLVPDKLELISKIKSDQLRNYSAIESILLKTRQHLNGFYHSLEVRINNLRFDSAELYARTTGAIQRALEQYSSQINLQKKLLYGLDPSAILSRGYSIVRLNGTVIKSAEEYKAGDELMIQLHQGQITIKDSKNEEEQQSRIEF